MPQAHDLPPATTTIAIEDTFLIARNNPNVWDEIEDSPIEASTTVPSKNPLPDSCYCVRIARQAGLNLPYQDAKYIKPNSGPTLNGGVIFKYGKVSHIAFIKAFLKDGFWVWEGNKIPCKTGYRLVRYNDPAIVGFWSNQN